jgi:ribosomal protein L14E/L6E/L27E
MPIFVPLVFKLIHRYPLKVTKSMGKKKVARRSKVKPFIKVINYAHLLPTRYQLELESLKGSVTNDTFKEPTQREESKKAIKKALEERYAKGQNRWCKLGSAAGRCVTKLTHQSSPSSGSRRLLGYRLLGYLGRLDGARSCTPRFIHTI